ncbi:sugar phosphate isomerase/epimerase family protein [Thalassotalea sediminis]|uniref:sugar phosphate isomerase/epimerase family protein n=1 Tax=Thalassotalea sediminis TaxID=1759089 RepID=UPI0025732EC9|nr:sugar phosphate isomerase/epimerase [Thalassotalea sediminis]
MKNKLLTLLCACLPFVSNAAYANEKQSVLPKLSVQLWSVKDDVNASFKQTLSSLAEMGFQGVEFAGAFGPFKDDPKALKNFLSSKALEASGAHLGFDQLNEENFAKTVEFYKAIGATMLIVPWDERAWHPDGVKEVVSLLNDLAIKLKPHGMRIGFHNHDQEFNNFEGTTYWDYIATNTSSDVVLQQDVGWTTYAGKDPVEYVKRYPGRTLTTHYKVRLPEGTTGKLPIIGKDTIDWLALTKANIAVGGTLWIVVEQEEYPNGLTPMEAVLASKHGLDKILEKL